MPTPVAHLEAARQQGAVATMHTLLALLQQQHPDSPLTPAQVQQFRRCCTRLAVQDATAEELLLAADACFSRAYPAGGGLPRPCARHSA